MIRHGSSIFLSLVFHTLIAVLVILTYKNVVSTKEEILEEKVCIELCNVVAQKPIIHPKSKPAVEPKIEPKPIIKKPKPKPTIKKVIKKEIIKEVPVVMPEIKPIVEQEIVKEKVEEKEIVEETFDQTSKQIIEEKSEARQEKQLIESKELRQEREYMQEHLAKIVQLLRDNLYYPRRARQMQEEGEVIVKFVISKDGSVHSIEVISSKSKILSRSAIKTIEDLSGRFPKPKKDLTLHVPIGYTLR